MPNGRRLEPPASKKDIVDTPARGKNNVDSSKKGEVLEATKKGCLAFATTSSCEMTRLMPAVQCSALSQPHDTLVLPMLVAVGGTMHRRSARRQRPSAEPRRHYFSTQRAPSRAAVYTQGRNGDRTHTPRCGAVGKARHDPAVNSARSSNQSPPRRCCPACRRRTQTCRCRARARRPACPP